MGAETAKVTRRPRDRRIEAEWNTRDDQFVVLSVWHGRGQLVATMRRERREISCGMESRIFAPFSDLLTVARRPIARYSAKSLEAFFEAQFELVTAELAGDVSEDGDRGLVAFAAAGTTA